MSPRTRAPRCASCGRRIREHHSDLEVLEASTGRVRRYHAGCGGVAYERARGIGGAWLAVYRRSETSAN